MRRSLGPAALILLLALGGCAPDRGVFATSTNIGIDADATAAKVVIGYDRTEGFIGPSYPQAGTAPSVVGFIDANQNVFDPKIRQLYATGEAAEIVTRSDKGPKPAPLDSTGTPRMMVFGTTTSVALRVGFGTAGPLPDSISFGYKRREASIIPVLPPTDSAPAKYAPTLASIDTGVTTSHGLSSTALGIRQFFATGNAARNLAWRDDIRDAFGAAALTAISAGEKEGKTILASTQSVADCIRAASGTLDQSQAKTWSLAVTALIDSGLLPSSERQRYLKATTKDQVFGLLRGNLTSDAERTAFTQKWSAAGPSCDKSTA